MNLQSLFSMIQAGHYYIPKFISPLGCSLIASLLCYNPCRRLFAEQPWSTHGSTLPQKLPWSTHGSTLPQKLPWSTHGSTLHQKLPWSTHGSTLPQKLPWSTHGSTLPQKGYHVCQWQWLTSASALARVHQGIDCPF